MENNNGKYFKYAIGEIVLVVIGILIALQINNWNIKRIERINEYSILLDLQVEFKENLVDAKRIIEGNKSVYNAMGSIQNNISSENFNQESMDTLMYHLFDWFDYTPKPGASNNLINSGNLNLIRNKELRKLLTIWSGIEAELDDDEQLAIRYSQDIILPFIVERYPMSNLEIIDHSASYYSNSDSEINTFILERNISYDMEALFRDKVFQSHISVKKIYARHNIMEGIHVVNTCKSILKLIEEEIELKND